MSDNRRRFRSIFEGIKQFFPTEPKGNTKRRLNVLAGLISGIVGSKRVNLPAIASKVPQSATRESRIKRFSRFLANESISTETYFLPFSRVLLEGLAHQTLVLVIDASEVGRNCLTLMVSVVYKKRALPIAPRRHDRQQGTLATRNTCPIGQAGRGDSPTRQRCGFSR